MDSSSSVLLESCVDSVASAIASAEGGAQRVELCDNLVEGGTTPSAGMIRSCVERATIPVFVIIRPRGGDFLYDDDDVAVMAEDIRTAAALGASGIVIGALRAEGTIDREITRRLLELARPLPVTFHRAFDMTRDLRESLDALMELGIDRVLTSGGAPRALDGTDAIADLVHRAGPQLRVMAGGGVRANHVAQLVERTGVREVHARLTESVESGMRYRAPRGVSRPFTPNEYERVVTSRDAVAMMVKAMTV
ncbi:MAG: copper homeostasis protein CutC [Gemmatimonadaceae bacterium]